MYGLMIVAVWAGDCTLRIEHDGRHASVSRQQVVYRQYWEQESTNPPQAVRWECYEEDTESSPLSPLEVAEEVLSYQERYQLTKKEIKDTDETGAEMCMVRAVGGQMVKDDYMRKVDTYNSPYSAYVKLVLDFGGQPRIGSGTLIKGKYVLTAGHNLHETAYDGSRIWVEKVTVVPAAAHNGYSPLGEYVCKAGHCHPKWLASPDRAYDLALLELHDDLSEIAGYMAVGVLEGNVSGEEIVLSGYPTAKGTGKIIKYPESPKERLDCRVGLWEREGPLLSLSTPELLRYRIPSYGGQSGGGLVKRLTDKSTVIGVHSGGPLEVNHIKGGGAFYNEGVRLTDAHCQWVNGVLTGTDPVSTTCKQFAREV